ncbi:uncharacterized protein PITG_01838 [Phytophthora infestans T30-4]|uniref:Uncharacterized protein n=1 Tax=Phytophthora infestans (strain T30-4) TaxID=403677 RepID=D0MU77_PHYIT|nr:uncharacterized protein PITG_01838 [Phytophthora infestans T30-4]EEY61524.1 hypothetical protein PITG_01838 [Phytophthora infestans T30-4]|eukprot:XP_002908441.1 hypothetical protein PITG_01838 [Phytophthora infestans T30-4]
MVAQSDNFKLSPSRKRALLHFARSFWHSDRHRDDRHFQLHCNLHNDKWRWSPPQSRMSKGDDDWCNAAAVT